MKRLIRKASEYYHLTNDPNFKLDISYENNQQEMGAGLYITPAEDVEKWDGLLSRRKFAIPVDISSLNIINESDFPSMGQMAKDLMAAGYTADDIRNLKPKGETFNRNKTDIVTKREWAKLKGYDAVRPHLDTREGQQIVILNPNKVGLGEPIPIEDII